MAYQPVLPDFEVIARSYATFSQQFSRFGNLPTLREGNTPTLHEGDQILEESRALRELMGALQGLITASNQNTIARLHNSSISKPDQILMPLRSVRNNVLIHHFPETLSAFNKLPIQVVEYILWALGAPTGGDSATLKHRLKLQCGLKELTLYPHVEEYRRNCLRKSEKWTYRKEK